MEKYRNPALPIEERVEDLLSRMTLEEKVAQLCGNLSPSFIVDGKVDIDALRKNFPNGHGRFTQFSTVGIVDPKFIAHVVNQVQKYFVEETRLGIPVAIQTENLCGYPGKGGTLYPAQINMGCTWEPELAREMARNIGEESRSVGISSAMSPVIDVARDPRWGRTYETYGEDPYLVTQFGKNYIGGMQGTGVSCIAKHFLGYAFTQGGANTTAFRCGKREMYEDFATPFEAAMKDEDLDSVMCNYGEIDGLPVIANPDIIGKLLRDEMGFKGICTSDGAAIMRVFNTYQIGKTYEEAGAIAKKAGADTEIPIGAAFAKLPEFVRSGFVSEQCIDESVRRVLRIKFKCGLFENPYCDEDVVVQDMATPEKKALSEKIAADSLVLLKNEGILPLRKGGKLAVVGPHAESLRYPVSGYTYPAYIEMMLGASRGESVGIGGMADLAEENRRKVVNTSNVFKRMLEIFSPEQRASLDDMNTILRKMEARTLREVLSERYDVRYEQGCAITGDDRSGFDAAVEAAKSSDAVVFACGGNCGWVNVTGGEGIDRSNLDLPGVQEELLETLIATGKPVIVILYGPQVFAVNYAQEHAAAIIQAFMPGQYAAKVLADAIDGTVNPGGKMTFSVPRHVGHIPVYYNHRQGSGYNRPPAAGIFKGGYVDGPDDPLYCFGYGLSYTTFEISSFGIDKREVEADGDLRISCKVKNTGKRKGDEVVQLYTTFKNTGIIRPVQELRGFKRVSLEPGEEKTVIFNLSLRQMGYYDENMEFVVEPGTLEIKIGNKCRDYPITEKIQIVGEKKNVKNRRVYTCQAEVI
ncbi:MAG: glycoside hydrolase family 3 C-terminal domain-containing protein [Spirochaetales bacterium]|nr:glycoside hydrolase family 3 C-terminal domain-containing protein [Spirochaetales bacterium]